MYFRDTNVLNIRETQCALFPAKWPFTCRREGWYFTTWQWGSKMNFFFWITLKVCLHSVVLIVVHFNAHTLACLCSLLSAVCFISCFTSCSGFFSTWFPFHNRKLVINYAAFWKLWKPIGCWMTLQQPGALTSFYETTAYKANVK